VDDQQREHIREDLTGIIKGEVLFDDLSRVLYSTDASIFQVQPAGVVVPRDEEDLQTLVRYAAEHQVPLIARGAGSGMAGESLGAGLVVDLSPHFRSVLEIGADTARVQPGVVYRDLSEQLARVQRRFAPDPASGEWCTIGGMLGTNASGARILRHGYTRDHVAELRVVLDTGDPAVVGRHALNQPEALPGGHLGDIILAVAALLGQNADLIRRCQPRTPYNRCGYLLTDVLSDEYLDLARLLVGSEGTLALFTEATLRTVPLPVGRGVVLLAFDRLDPAVRAAQLALPSQPAACELIDHRLLTLARGQDAAVAALVPPSAEVVLLVEYESDTATGARDAARDLENRLYRSERLALFATTAWKPPDLDQLWRLREAALPSLYGLRGQAHPVAMIEDIGVPLEELLGYLRRVQDILQHFETTASFLVHAGTGQVHTRPFLDMERPEDVARLRAITEEVYALAVELGGTVSTQHGTGLARTPWVARQYGELYPILTELKTIFDPQHLFNPGKIIATEATPSAWPTRTYLAAPVAEKAQAPATGNGEALDPDDTSQAANALRWLPDEVRTEVANCNGCGECRTEASSQRMCPIFRATHAEAATPRAKANLMRHLLRADTDSRQLSSDDVRAVADLCVNCKMCARECRAHVNIPKLMLEAKAANVAEHGLARSDWVLARVENFAALGSALAFLVNAALGSRTLRWLLERSFGVSRKRRLPAFASRSFLRQARRRGWTRPPRPHRQRVAYFVDVFANYNDPQIAEAVVAVLHHNDIEVYVPPEQIGCGMAPLAQGDVETAREVAQVNLRVLTELAREGYPILCSEPTAAYMLRHDYLDLIDDPDARLVADHTVELTAFLGDLHRQRQLRTDFRPLPYEVGHHVPCHLRALGQPAAGPTLLGLIPDLRVRTIDISCSGMAGTFGLKAENYVVSLQAGQPMLQELARASVRFGSTECSTCRLQMEDGGRKRTLHPVQYLALAYGLMPELAGRLEQPIRDLVLQ
jgi:FAD/FMN-containing dehydrogenase/Fe-S oxidoreductase